MAKVAINNINKVQDVVAMDALTPGDQAQIYVVDEHMCYMYFTSGIDNGCHVDGKGSCPGAGHWYKDYALFKCLLYSVEDSYNFSANGATDVTNKCTQREKDYLNR